jgi:outer membrane autotransporter protein
MLMLFSSIMICQTDSSANNETSPPPDNEIFVSGGIAYSYLPYEFSKYWNPGMNASLGYGLSFTPGDYGYSTLLLLAEYASFGLKESAYRDAQQNLNPNATISGGKTQSFTVTVNYKGTVSTTKTSIAPYFVFGIGYMLFRSDSVLVNNIGALSIEGDAISTVTWSFGVGIEVPVTDMFAGYVQAKSVIGTFDRPRQYFPITAGLRLRF